MACELPFEKQIPLSRFSTNEIVAEAVSRGIVAQISGSTIWRWLHQDAIKPWQYRSWIFPRDQQFEQKAGRVFWIVDNGSAHRGQSSIDRLKKSWSNLVLVHLPVHASWLNQIEIYFSILERKVLTPNYYSSFDELAETIINFQKRYQEIAEPFEWKFTKNKLKEMLTKLSNKSILMAKAA